MVEKYSTVIIGSGIIGAAAAWQLASRNQQVLVLEQFDYLHKMGASHGETRNLNISYLNNEYIKLAQEAKYLWHSIETQTEKTLYDRVGVISQGPEALLYKIAELLQDNGEAFEILSSSAAKKKWGQFNFSESVLYTPESGRIRAQDAIIAITELAKSLGAEFRYEHKVDKIDLLPNKKVKLICSDKEYEVDNVIVAAGAWTGGLLEGIVTDLPKLKVTKEQPVHFALKKNISVEDVSNFPSFNHFNAYEHKGQTKSVYGMYTPGVGVKVGVHGIGHEIDITKYDACADNSSVEFLKHYSNKHLAIVDVNNYEAISCTYTSTIDENFIVDRYESIIIAAGFSGHGFKFAPVIAKKIADMLIEGSNSYSMFSLVSKRENTSLYEAEGLSAAKGRLGWPEFDIKGGRMRIRPAMPKEYPILADLSERAYEHDYPIADGYRAVIRDIAGRAAWTQVWLAEIIDTGEIVATITMPHSNSRVSTLAENEEFDLRLLAVSEKHRSRGIAEVIMRFAIQQAKKRGNKRVVLNSGVEMTGAHALYFKLGFKIVTEREISFVGDEGNLIRVPSFVLEI